MLKILIVDDHILVCEGMVLTLSRLGGVECVEVGTVDDAVAQLEKGGFDLVIIDLNLPGMDGFSLLAVLSKRFPDLPAIVTSGILDDDETIRRVRSGGASGFVSKKHSGKALLEAVQLVLRGGVYFPTLKPEKKGGRQQSHGSGRYGLTVAQNRVLDLLAQGKTNGEIARLLGLAEGTVKVHVSAILRALSVNSRAQALVVLARNGHGL